MTLNTRCPACTTVFSVPPSVLSASAGWVRCGRCSEVFDATSHLEEGPDSQLDETADRLLRQMQIPLAPGDLAQQGMRSGRDGGLPPQQSATPTLYSSQAVAGGIAPRLTPKRSSVERRRKSGGTDVGTWAQPDRSAAVAAAKNETGQSTAASDELDRQSLQPNGLVQTSYVAASQVTSRLAAHLSALSAATWIGSTLAIVLLTLLLGLQVLWTQRNELATYYPSLKPTLHALCQQLHCTLMPMRRLDMVAIDNSAFRIVSPSEKGDRYHLSWTVSNLALVPVAAPAMELTLQDVLDRPLLRKVLTPADLGTPDLAIAAEGKWQGSIQLNVLVPDGGVKVSGYRLIAFYP